MANDVTDEFKLTEATDEFRSLHTDGSTLTVATGKYYGSDLTFRAREAPSAPSQVDVAVARDIMGKTYDIFG